MKPQQHHVGAVSRKFRVFRELQRMREATCKPACGVNLLNLLQNNVDEPLNAPEWIG